MMRNRLAIQIAPLLLLLIACRDPRLSALTGTRIGTPSPAATQAPEESPPDTLLGGIVVYPSGRPTPTPRPGSNPAPVNTPAPSPEPTIDCAIFDPDRTVSLYDCFPAASIEVTLGGAEPWEHLTSLVLRVPVASGSNPLGPSEARVRARVLFSNGTRLLSQDDTPMTRLVTWSSSRADLVSVDAAGRVQVVAQATGSATITGRTLDGAHGASVQVTVDDSGDLELVVD